jgi:hypothetical protein
VQIHCVRSLLQSVHRAETFICAEDCAAPAAGANGLHSPFATLQDGGAVLTRSAAHGRTMMSHPARRDTARAASFDRRATGDLTKTVEAKLGEISVGGCRRSRRSRQAGKPRLGGVRVPDGPGSVRRGRAMPVPACVVVLPPTPRMVRRSPVESGPDLFPGPLCGGSHGARHPAGSCRRAEASASSCSSSRASSWESWSISASADPAGTRPRGWAGAPAPAASA